MSTKRWNIDATLSQVIALDKQLKADYASHDYYVDKILNEDLDVLVEKSDVEWMLGYAVREAGERDVLRGLIEVVTGEAYGDPAESVAVAARCDEIRAAIEAAEDAPKLELVTDES